jgi:hypothetical protein
LARVALQVEHAGAIRYVLWITNTKFMSTPVWTIPNQNNVEDSQSQIH